MTQTPERALLEVPKLPAATQDALAAILLEEIASEQRWTHSFENSEDALEMLAAEALAEHAAGRTKPW